MGNRGNLASRRISGAAKPALASSMVAGLAGLMLAPTAGQAEEAQALVARDSGGGASTTVSGVDVRTGGTVKPASPKYTAPLKDTPQTITIIPAETLERQNLLTLREALSTVPGITFGAGEGGGGYGDSINLRGYSANADIMVDGVRDSAQYTRSDPFNLQQIEVVNGASSVYSGAGSVGGSINLSTKTPQPEDRTVVNLGVGTADFGRATIDANQMVTDTVAVRVNAMVHRNDVPGRDAERFKRWGFAPSIAFGVGTPTKLVLSWYHQQDDNIPQYGVPFYNGRPVPGIDSSTYFGYANVDRQKINVDTLTAVIEHQFDDNLSVRNLSRYQEVTQFSRVNPPQGTFCLDNGQRPIGWSQTATEINLSGYQPCTTPGFYQPSGPRGTTRDSLNRLLYNQTDLTANFVTGVLEHNLVVGVSLLEEDFGLKSGNSLRNPGGATPNPVLPPMSIANPDTTYTGPVNFIVTALQDGERSNQAAYLFDTIKLGEHWQLTGGLRYEITNGSNRSDSVATTGAVTPGQTFENSAHLFSYRVGLVYKPTESVSLYGAYGNSKTPSQTNVNGGCNADTCNVNPEAAVNYELGAKWAPYNGRLLASVALFRNERTNYRVPSADPTLPEQVLNGSSRVDGIAVSLAGKLTQQWSVQANYTYLDSEVLQGASDFVASGGVSGTQRDWIKGDPLTNVPAHAFSIWTTYDFTDRVQLGYGVTYTDGVYLSQHTGIASIPATDPVSYVGRSTIPLVKTQSYSVHRLTATFRVTERLDLTLNVNNVFDKTYYLRGRNNGWATPGEGRSGVLTASYRF